MQLQKARILLSGASADIPAVTPITEPSGKRRGRPKGSVNKKLESIASAPANKVRATISAEGNARIAAAQRARWIALKNSSNAGEPAAKKRLKKESKKTVTQAKKVLATKRAPTVKSVVLTKESQDTIRLPYLSLPFLNPHFTLPVTTRKSLIPLD